MPPSLGRANRASNWPLLSLSSVCKMGTGTETVLSLVPWSCSWRLVTPSSSRPYSAAGPECHFSWVHSCPQILGCRMHASWAAALTLLFHIPIPPEPTVSLLSWLLPCHSAPPSWWPLFLLCPSSFSRLSPHSPQSSRTSSSLLPLCSPPTPPSWLSSLLL